MRRRRWLSNLGLILVPILLAVLRSLNGSSQRVDPRLVSIPAGQYAVSHVDELGRIHLDLPASIIQARQGETDADSHVRSWVEVELLGIEWTDRESAIAYLQNRIVHQAVSIRYDRRRLSPTYVLQAYIYHDRQLLNAELVRLQWARPSPHPSDFGPIVRQIAGK